MSLKFKALGLGLLALLATSAFAAINASANGNGHIVIGASSGKIVGTESGEHKVHLVAHGLSGEIGCGVAKYETAFTGETQTEVTVKPEYDKCGTTPNENVTVTMNGCHFQFTVAEGTNDAKEQTAHLRCTTEGLPYVEVHHPNCTIRIHEQSVDTGLTYTHKNENGINYTTMNVNVEFATTYEGGICIFTGTNHTGTLKGSVTVEAFNANNEKVNLTAT